MKKAIRNIALCAVCLIVTANIASGKEWRGIVPLKSKRNDVERRLGAPKMLSYSDAYYSFAKEIVVVQYQTATCDEDFLGLGWNVPIGTVIGIGVVPKGAHRREEYQLATGFQMADNGGGFIYYFDDAAGLRVETYKDRVTLVEYYPEAARNDLKCPRTKTCCIDFFSRFDEYAALSFADEKARLDNFAIQVNSLAGRGTIEVLGPSKRARQQHMKAAARARTYLVKERGLEPERILIVDGGFSESVLTRLNMYSIGGLGSLIYINPEKDPASTSKKP